MLYKIGLTSYILNFKFGFQNRILHANHTKSFSISRLTSYLQERIQDLLLRVHNKKDRQQGERRKASLLFFVRLLRIDSFSAKKKCAVLKGFFQPFNTNFGVELSTRQLPLYPVKAKA
jgi:hypothetical protein